jgi:division protein CdvB (Snf7/Vps24/ESCRT-III family)
MAFLFGGGKKASQDPVKDYQRELRHAMRSMDREDLKGAAGEKTLIASITKNAREQKMDLCKAKAKELVRLRSHRTRIATMKGHMSTLSHQLSTVQSAKVMQETVAKTTHLLQKLNGRLDAKSIHKMLYEFERQSTQFADGQEVLEETLDSIFETADEQSNTDQAVERIFDELKLDMQLSMGSAGRDQSVHPVTSEDDLATSPCHLRAPWALCRD